jgi:hypothetical protein
MLDEEDLLPVKPQDDTIADVIHLNRRLQGETSPRVRHAPGGRVAACSSHCVSLTGALSKVCR